VIVITSPIAARATTADAFCFNALIPTSAMCSIVEHRRSRRAAASIKRRRDVAAHVRKRAEDLAHGHVADEGVVYGGHARARYGRGVTPKPDSTPAQRWFDPGIRARVSAQNRKTEAIEEVWL
jgi:hypothetical protein